MKKRAYCIRMLTVTCAVLISVLVVTNYAEAKTAGEINASVNAAMNRFLQTGGWR
jgi:hypothetical protein